MASNKGAIRLGGIYTLVGLVDEWLTDDALEQEEQQKEGQVIINNLCSYIRSPFPLASKTEYFQFDVAPAGYTGDFVTDQVTFREEQDVRRTIFVEMSKRSSTLSIDKKVTNPGPWSKFDFDFSQAQIFYPLNDITIEKPHFIASRFYGKADFRNTVFPHDQNFNRAIFNESPMIDEMQFAKVLNLSGAIFAEEMRFSNVNFKQKIKFNGARFEKGLYMLNVDFHGDALFEETEFKDTVYFSRVTFMQSANFSKTYFNHDAYFSGADFMQSTNFSKTYFNHDAYFSRADFMQSTNFSKTYFNHDAHFIGAVFEQNAYFREAAFKQNANFSRAKFTQTANFYRAAFSASSPKFVETFEDSDKTFRARFAALTKDREAHNFTVSEGSFPIPPGEAELGDGVKHHIPVGTVLFDPSSGETSAPAKPLDKSNDGEEDKSK